MGTIRRTVLVMIRGLLVARQRSRRARSLLRSACVSSTASESALDEPWGAGMPLGPASSPAASSSPPALASRAATLSPKGTSSSGMSGTSSSSAAPAPSSSAASGSPRFLPLVPAAAAVRTSTAWPSLSGPSTVTSFRVCERGLGRSSPSAATTTCLALAADEGSSAPSVEGVSAMTAGCSPPDDLTGTTSNTGFALLPRATRREGPSVPCCSRAHMMTSCLPAAVPFAGVAPTRTRASSCAATLPSSAPAWQAHTYASPHSETAATWKPLPWASPASPRGQVSRLTGGSSRDKVAAAGATLFFAFLAGGSAEDQTARWRSPLAADTAWEPSGAKEIALTGVGCPVYLALRS
mmetsp:Transcript_18584/g.39903  ORF Transcript_18584/g.39903 Transcript_18584/m.39903 type:complete len:352 (-) Transcript_18584:74-1129(-)